MNKLIIILIVLIVLVYAKYYMSPNPVFQILQTSISKTKPSLLFEKSPIIIEEPLVQCADLLPSLFRYLYIVKRSYKTTPNNVLQQNKCKYMIVSPLQEDAIVQIVHPKHSRLLRQSTTINNTKHKIAFVDIKLKKNQCLILPLYWWYKVNSSETMRIQLDDALSLFFGKL